MIASSVALVSTAGPDGTWGNVDDEVFLVTGLPATPVATPLRRPGGFAVGYLDPANSRPTRLDGDTAVVYSVGADTLPTTGDERITILDTLTGTPTIVDYPAPYLIPAPPVRIAGDRLAALGATAPPAGDGLPGTFDDEMVVMDLTAGTILTIPSGPLDPAGATSLSLPVAADANTAFFINIGADTPPGSADDVCG